MSLPMKQHSDQIFMCERMYVCGCMGSNKFNVNAFLRPFIQCLLYLCLHFYIYLHVCLRRQMVFTFVWFWISYFENTYMHIIYGICVCLPNLLVYTTVCLYVGIFFLFLIFILQWQMAVSYSINAWQNACRQPSSEYVITAILINKKMRNCLCVCLCDYKDKCAIDGVRIYMYVCKLTI